MLYRHKSRQWFKFFLLHCLFFFHNFFVGINLSCCIVGVMEEMSRKRARRYSSVELSREIKFGRKMLLSRDGKTSTALWAVRVLFKGLALGPGSKR